MDRQLEGRELLFGSSERAAYTICDVFHITVDDVAADALRRFGGAAMLAVAAKHPLLRTRCVYSESSLPRFHTEAALPAGAASGMFSVATAADARDWERIVHRTLNGPADHSHLPIWRVTFVSPSPAEAAAAGSTGASPAHLIVTTDHSVADGFSCSRVAHDFLTAVCTLAARALDAAAAVAAAPVFEPLPPPPTARHICHGGEPGRLFRWTAGPLIDMIGSAELRKLRKTPPVLPLHPAVAARGLVLPYRAAPTPGWSLFASGSREGLTASLARCKAEKVTLHGAVIAALLAAHSRVALRAGSSTSSRPEEQVVAMNMDVDFNLRKRASPSLGDEHVGLLISWGTLASFAPAGKGVRMSDRFWDVARRGKAETEAMIAAMDTRLSHFFFERAFASEAAAVSRLASACPGGVIGDINVSNLGVYPFPARHEVSMPSMPADGVAMAAEGGAGGSGAAESILSATAGDAAGAGSAAAATGRPPRRGAITITSHHLVNSASPVSSCGIWFLTTLAGQPAYSLHYKSAHEPTARVFADAVAAFEGVGSIGPEETMAAVAARLCTWGARSAATTATGTAAGGTGGAGGAGASVASEGVAAGSALPPYAPVITDADSEAL